MNFERIFLKCAVYAGILLIFSQVSFAESNFNIFFGDSAQYRDVLIAEVISADTIRLQSGERVKLIGLRAPEPPKVKKEIKRDPYGFVIKPKVKPTVRIEVEAFKFAKELLEGQRVRLELDDEKKNSDYATLAYVFLLKDDTFANTEILRQGFAHLQIRPPNMKYAQQLREAYREARREMKGLQGE